MRRIDIADVAARRREKPGRVRTPCLPAGAVGQLRRLELHGPKDSPPAAYEANIIGGPNAFVMPAQSGPEFTDAVRRKLILEIAGTTPETQFASVLLDTLKVGE
ncbi:DUF1194 domain-containing protein [Yoonia sp.]|uniref:DUF1194 domain-containing protein n=1 Tax=Yoonia sp. TaxID=2212373 RepID=UPI0039771915